MVCVCVADMGEHRDARFMPYQSTSIIRGSQGKEKGDVYVYVIGWKCRQVTRSRRLFESTERVYGGRNDVARVGREEEEESTVNYPSNKLVHHANT